MPNETLETKSSSPTTPRSSNDADAKSLLPNVLRLIVKVAGEGGEAWLKKLKAQDPAKFATILVQLSKLADKYLEQPQELIEQRFKGVTDKELLNDLFDYLTAEFRAKGFDLVLRQKPLDNISSERKS